VIKKTNCPKIEVRMTALPSLLTITLTFDLDMTLTFNPHRVMVMTHTGAINQVKGQLIGKIRLRVETDGQTDRHERSL